jgi:hypothetical protein
MKPLGKYYNMYVSGSLKIRPKIRPVDMNNTKLGPTKQQVLLWADF